MTKFYNFIKKPDIGSIVKVYCGKDGCRYGKVYGFFIRSEIRKDDFDRNGKFIAGYDIETECVLLKEIPDVPFNRIDYFLDLNRVDFIT